MELAKEKPGPPPREHPASALRKANAGTGFLLLFGSIWAVVGVFVTSIFLILDGGPWRDALLDRHAAVANARVTGTRPTSGRVNGRRVQEIDYTFQDSAGADHQGKIGTTDSALLQQATIGQALPVEYDPEQPSRNRLRGTKISIFGMFVFMPMAFAAVGLVLVGIALVDLRRRRTIYINGAVAAGVVERVEKTTMRQNRRRIQRVFYKFSADSGPITNSFTTFLEPAVGTSLWILYDPNDPTRNLPA